MTENNITSLQKMRVTVADVKNQMTAVYKDITFLAKESDFDDLIMLRAELKDSIKVSTNLFEQWIERKMPPLD